MPRLSLPRVHRRSALAVGVLALAVGACMEAPAQSGAVTLGAADGDDAITIAAVDNAFEPEAVAAAVDEEVTIEVTNEGGSAHNLVIDDLDISTGTLEAGDVATVTLTVPDGGVEYVCTLHGGMRGRITTT